MKFIYSLSALASVAVADICNDVCGDACDEGNQDLVNWDKAGFESADECAANACSVKFADDVDAWHVCEEGARELEGRKYNKIIKMTRSLLAANGKTTMSMRQLHKKIQNYGCHCFPNFKSTIGGKGKPVDQLDEVCRSLFRCYRCIDIESDEYGSCDTNQGGYKYGLLENEGGSRDINCDTMFNKSPMCKTHQCQCDRQFADSLAALFEDGSNWAYNPDYWLNPKYVKRAEANGDPIFDKNASCDAVASPPADQCCGADYPFKIPYDSQNRECCAAAYKSYDFFAQECCDDGTVAPIGKC